MHRIFIFTREKNSQEGKQEKRKQSPPSNCIHLHARKQLVPCTMYKKQLRR